MEISSSEEVCYPSFGKGNRFTLYSRTIRSQKQEDYRNLYTYKHESIKGDSKSFGRFGLREIKENKTRHSHPKWQYMSGKTRHINELVVILFEHSTKQEQMEKIKLWIKENQITFWIISVILFSLFCLFIIWLFTRPAFSSTWDFSNSGQVGDTIGGITAPIINIIGALLVYFSFKEQRKANDIQNTALISEMRLNRLKNNADILYRLYNENKEDLMLLEYSGRKGLEALSLMCEDGKLFEKHEYFDSFLGILYRLNNINEKLKTEELDPIDKGFLSKSLELFYLSKIQKQFVMAFELAEKKGNKEVLEYLKPVKIEFQKYYPE